MRSSRGGAFRRSAAASARASPKVKWTACPSVLKPTTYMNASGAALASLRADPAFDPARDLLILVDDFAIPSGTFRLRSEGSAGGHNGLKSVESALLSQQYARLRIGVGPLPEGVSDWSEYVLAPFTPEQREQVEAVMPELVDAVEKWLR